MVKKKILILSASPLRDKLADELIAQELRVLGNEVHVRPCLREGRKAVLDIKPDIVVVPPIRNPYSRDMVHTLKQWGVGVVSRHTEASCDWQDYKKLNPQERGEILGRWVYSIDLEIVWGKDEEQILSQRRVPFPVKSVGSFSADKYLNQDFIKRYSNRPNFNKKYGFTKKRTILIGCPWGFADSAPDLQIDDIPIAKKDTEGLQKQLVMIQQVHQAFPEYNILVTLHPGVVVEPYKQALAQSKIPLDTESVATELLVNTDILIHAGSTMAMGAHFLDMPAFQFGDANSKGKQDWWANPDSPLSKISPYCKTPSELIEKIKKVAFKSNANKKTLKVLTAGRYGKMDGKATKRAARLIDKIPGEFKLCWPDSTQDYTQLTILRQPEQWLHMTRCGICGHPFVVIKDEWLDMLCNATGLDKNKLRPPFGTHCPWCAARFYGNDSGDNPGKAQFSAPAPKNAIGTTPQ